MPIYKPSELLNFLDSLGIAPKKGLSQNFLIDRNILHKIAAAAHLQPGDLVLEVGPGPGSLTEELLNKGAAVVAVEKDVVLAGALDRLKTAENRLEVYCDDILTFPIENVIGNRISPTHKAKVIANLPYHLTTPIIVQLVTRRHLFSHLILMVQDEVARRFVAKPKTSDYSSFTLFLNFYTNAQYAFTVNSSCFYPPPKVNSAIVVLELKEPPKVSDEEAFFKMTRTAFGKRRKMLRGSLKELYTPADVESALTQIGQNSQARPEDLSLETFISLFEALEKHKTTTTIIK